MEPLVLEKMLEISRHMAETRELSPMLHYAVGEAMEMVNAEHGFLVLIDTKGDLHFHVKRDRDGNVLAHAEEEISTTIFNKAISQSEPVFIVDALADPQFLQSSSVTALQLRSVMCVPLTSRGNTIGALYMENRASANIFRPSDLAPLIFFANQAAVLIENAVLNETLEQRVQERTEELNQAMNQLERSWLEAVEANRLRTTFLANLTHDMRLPLSVAIGATSMIEDSTFGDINGDQKEWLGKVMEALRHVVQLTDDLFHLTSFTGRQEDGDAANVLTFVTESLELAPFLSQVHKVGSALPWEKGVNFVLDLEEDLPVLTFDPIRIRQVIFNLLSNALKFTHKGEVRLYACQLEDEQAVLIGLRDSGSGIPPEKLNLIFERFQQLDQDAHQRRNGAGLGLAISRELVEMHGGTIWAENAASGGTDFKFTLPLVK